jgi:iron complex outermembrane receptor protein
MLNDHSFRLSGAIAGACALASSLSVHAQGVANDAELAPVVVTGTPAGARSGLPPGMSASTASKTAEQLRTQNLFNPEDALQYMPNTTVRKRYAGDRNALIAGRSFGTLQPSRALVYVDGYLISNFLGRFDAPRWNMISPEAIERVDMLYGPYSALYPGNSIGTTVAVTQHAPQAFEVRGRLSGYRQTFGQYGHKDHYDGQQLSLQIGDRLASGLWYVADLNHQDSTSQPMQYHTLAVPAANAVTGTLVSGIRYDTDSKGARRAVFGASAGAIDHTVQDTVNLRAGYRFTSTLEASAMASWWHNDTDTRNVTFLRDAAGAEIWSGNVTDGVKSYSIPESIFAPYTRDETHRQLGLTFKTRHAQGWNASLVLSQYRILGDTQRTAGKPDPVAASGGAGMVTRREGTGWHTAEAQFTWKPSPQDWTGGRHALAFGLHRNGYKLDNTVSDADNWKTDGGRLSQYYRGKTEVTALYAQDAWRMADDWRLTTGWREEWFEAADGSQLGVGAYPSRKLRGSSPKLALTFSATDDLLLKLSVGRGVRFPNVEELYNGTSTSGGVTLSDPDLKAEASNAVELSAEQEWAHQRLRVSLFHDDVRNAILRQSSPDPGACAFAGPPLVSNRYDCVRNVDRVKTEGIELTWSGEDIGVRGLGLEASAAYTFRSEVVANQADPSMIGKWWLRVPRTRATLQATWKPDDQWLFAAGYRHQGRAYNDTANGDVNPNVYGGVSKVNQVDLRGARRLTKQLELAVGLNNATDQRAYQSHPYPGRTLFAELRFKN